MAFSADQEFDQFLDQKLDERLRSLTTPQTAAQPAGPIVMNLGGQQMSFQSQQELEAAMNTFLGAVAAKEAERAQAPAAPAQRLRGDEEMQPTWNQTEFVEQMTKDPRSGLNYALNHMLFEGREPDAAKRVKSMLQEGPQVKQALAAYQFLDSHPEFKAMAAPQHGQQLERLREQLGFNRDFDGLESTYLVAMQRGLLPDFKSAYVNALQQQQQQQWMMAQQQRAVPQGPPDPLGMFAPEPEYAPQPQPQQPQYNNYGQTAMDPRAFNGGMGGAPPPGTGGANPWMTAPPNAGRGGATMPAGRVDPESLSLQQLESIFGQLGTPNAHMGR